jgi:hypothetical protein
MSSAIVHALDTAWVASAAALQITVDTETFVGEGPASNRLDAPDGAAGATATATPAAPIDLSGFDELRFWIRSSRPANGSQDAPFFLEFSFSDANDAPGAPHTWLVPVNRADTWEQRRLGVESELRSAVNQLRFRCLTNDAFTCNVDELLAVHEEMLVDVEGALAEALGAVAPVVVEAPPAPTAANAPAIVATPLGAIEDQARSGQYLQRDSFRVRGAQIVCSVRPSARAYACDYELTALGTDRTQQASIYEGILRQMTLDTGLRVNGSYAPVSLLDPPQLRRRTTGQAGPVYVRIGTRLEVAPRSEQVWVQQLEVGSARIDAPLDFEQIVLEL